MNPQGTEFTQTPVSVSRSRSNSGSCPLPSAPNTQIVSCTSANASGGMIAVTVEENGDKFFATIWKIQGGNSWDPVVQTPIYSRQGGSGGSPDPIQIVPESTDFLQVFNLIYVGFDWGGSGGYWTYEVVDWAIGDSDPQVALVTSGRPAAGMTPWAGNLLLQANHLKQSDPTCCPSEREFLMIEHPNDRTRVPAVSTIVARDETTPELLAKDVYLAWINGNLGSISSQRISSQARQWLQDNGGGGGVDDHVLQGPSCPWNGAVFECTLISTAWRLTWRIEPGHGGTTPTGAHRLVEIVRHSP